MELKEYRKKELTFFVIANTIVLLYLSGVFSFGDSNSKLIISICESLLFSSVLSVYIIVFDAIIPVRVKDCIIYWWKYLPGETVFTSIREKNDDNRFSKEKVIKKYSDIYKQIDMMTDEKEKNKQQNYYWYSIYKKHCDKSAIAYSHKDYIMCRDLTTSTVITAIVYMAGSLLLHICDISLYGLLFIFVLYILTNLATRMKAKRFVFTVIATDLYS